MAGSGLRFLGAFACVGAIFIAAATTGERSEAKTKAAGPDDPGRNDVADVPEADVVIRAGKQLQRIIVTDDSDGTFVAPGGTYSYRGVVGLTSCENAADAAYCNTLGFRIRGPGGTVPNRRWSDDIALAVDEADGLLLDRFVLRVTGDRLQDGSGAALGPYTVHYALYRTCPGASTVPQVIPGTENEVTISTNIGGITEIVHFTFGNVFLRTNELWVGVSFDRMQCGVVVGAPATKGLSADRIDAPGAACNGSFGGFPGASHASFYFELYVRNDAPPTFIGYRNTDQSQVAYSPGLSTVGWRFADDITLGVPQCNLIAYEFAFKEAIVGADLRTHLDNENPETAGVIEGTECFATPTGANVEIARCELPEPALLTEQSTLWVAFRTHSTSKGLVQTCTNALVGDTSNVWMIYDPDSGEWVPEEGESGCWGGFDITLYCAGPPPEGACCDMVLGDCVGGDDNGKGCTINADCADPGQCEAVCRELPEMNCSSWWVDTPLLWAEGGRCGPVCDAGGSVGERCSDDNDCPDGSCIGSFCDCGPSAGQPCTRAADCPGICQNGDRAQCTDTPFIEACGLAACCKPSDPDDPDPLRCENLTANQCYAVPPEGAPRKYEPGLYCNVDGQRCPVQACLVRTGDCTLPQPAYCVGGDREGWLCPMFEFPSRCMMGELGGNCEEGSPSEGDLCSLYELTPCGVDDTQDPPVPWECVPAHCQGIPGCDDDFCCTEVCLQPGQWFCCQVHWDQQCAETAIHICGGLRPSNDECYHPSPGKGARVVSIPSTPSSDSISATEGADPPFCCHEEDPGAQGFATVWYKF
jgi:hypothetical protein